MSSFHWGSSLLPCMGGTTLYMGVVLNLEQPPHDVPPQNPGPWDLDCNTSVEPRMSQQHLEGD